MHIKPILHKHHVAGNIALDYFVYFLQQKNQFCTSASLEQYCQLYCPSESL
jgi:hypothetical protein